MDSVTHASESKNRIVYHDGINELLPSNYIDHMCIATKLPPVHLQAYIENYAILYNRNLVSSEDWLILPDLNPYLIVYDSTALLSQNQLQIQISFIGPRTRGIRVSRSSRGTTILIRFKPFGLEPFIPCLPEDLVNRNMPVQQLWGEKSSLLYARINETNDIGERLKALENFLTLIQNHTTAIDSRTLHFLRFIYDATENYKVKELAKVIGMSERYLLSMTICNTGLPPKKIIRIHRLLETMKSLGNTSLEKFNWAALAYQHMYADQSHMIDDFVEFLDISPERLVRKIGGSNP
jgi:AraC-like DNA-binding protein